MFRLFGSIINPILALNAFIVVVISIIIGHVSNSYFGIATGFLSVMVILTTPALRVKFFGNDWTFRVPVFPGAGFFKTALALTLISAGIFAFMGEDMTGSIFDDFRISKARQTVANKIKIIKAGNCYFEKNKRWQYIDRTTGLFLKEEKKDANGLKLFKFRLVGIDGRYDGPVVWVPVIRVGDRAITTLHKTMKKGGSISTGSRKGVAIKTLPPVVKKSLRVVILTPEQLVLRDQHKNSPDKFLLHLYELQPWDSVVVEEDFIIRVTGKRADPATSIYFGVEKAYDLWGSVVKIPKGTNFLLKKMSQISIVSQGNQKFDYPLKLKKVN